MPENDEEKKQLAVENQGDHHFAKVAVDPDTKDVSAGMIYNFSDHATAALQFVDGKMAGTVLHTGDTHSLQIDAKQDGTFTGTFKEARFGGVEVAFEGGVAKLLKGQLPATGLEVNGDHHAVRLMTSADGKLSGSIESTAVQGGVFKIKLENGSLSGSFVHAGDNHETEISLSKNAWSANVSFGKGDTKLNLSVQKGKSETKAFAGVKLKF
jgi:autotransporter translocation and assembly factor TamB